MTIAQECTRRLLWEGCLNVRDLGGYPTVDGCETRWGAVIRADNLAQLSEAGQAALIDYGVRTIVDLRTAEEIAQHPTPFANTNSHGITYINISLVDPAVAKPEFTTLADDYTYMLDRFKPAVAATMTAIARAPAGGVLIHCVGGKDRTGIISALLLALAGVPWDVIGADYALSAEYLRPLDEEYLANGPGERVDRQTHIEKYRPRPGVMIEVLRRLDERYGGVEAYLQVAGVMPENIARLRERLLFDSWANVEV
jgi:protein-tyrosine phosphatase